MSSEHGLDPADKESDALVQAQNIANAGDLEDAAYLQEVQTQLLKFAELQLKDRQLAEDAVQEALIGALKNASSFKGRAAFKTWMFAILKNKIADILRKRHRTMEINNLDSISDDDEREIGSFFNERNHWVQEAMPQHWADPENSFQQEQFWLVLETCLNNLPARQAKVFMMREFVGLDTEEICKEEDLSISNLHVILYRARTRLQKCLEVRWFGAEANV